MLSKGNARIPYSLGEFGALVFCPISVFTLLLCCFLSLLSVLSSSLSFEDISEGAFRGSKTVNMPLKHAKRLLCTYNWRLLSDKQVTSVHGIPPPSLLRALLGCVALSQQIRLSHLKRWAIWWSRVPNPPGVEAKGFCRCPEVRRTFPRQVGASRLKVLQSRTNVLKLNQPAVHPWTPTRQLLSSPYLAFKNSCSLLGFWKAWNVTGFPKGTMSHHGRILLCEPIRAHRLLSRSNRSLRFSLGCQTLQLQWWQQLTSDVKGMWPSLLALKNIRGCVCGWRNGSWANNEALSESPSSAPSTQYIRWLKGNRHFWPS